MMVLHALDLSQLGGVDRKDRRRKLRHGVALSIFEQASVESGPLWAFPRRRMRASRSQMEALW